MESKKIVKVELSIEKHAWNVIKLLDEYMRDEIGLGQPMPEGLDVEIIEGLRKHPGYLGFFACVGNDFAALANCNLNFSTWQGRPLLNIHDFIVSSSYRRQGLGMFLLRGIEDYAVSSGCCRINLEVRHDNYRAQDLYLKAGFSACSPPNYFWEKQL